MSKKLEPEHMQLHNRRFRLQEEKNIPLYSPPYTNFEIYGVDGLFINLATCDHQEKAERVVACVNACAGIPDPAKALEDARKALREIIARINGVKGKLTTPCEDDCLEFAESALRSLTPSQEQKEV